MPKTACVCQRANTTNTPEFQNPKTEEKKSLLTILKKELRATFSGKTLTGKERKYTALKITLSFKKFKWDNIESDYNDILTQIVAINDLIK